MKLSDFDYPLSEELIARYPLEERTASRLMCFNRKTGSISHQQFKDLLTFVHPNDLIVFNNTQVIPARFYGYKESGGQVEVLVERILDQHRVLAHLRVSKTPAIGSYIHFENNIRFEMLKRQDNLFELRCLSKDPVLSVIESIGEIPLPPYFNRDPDDSDKERYQTVYAKHKGSVAAPTAGLHFDNELLDKLKKHRIETGWVTLHVGAGTFAPVRVEEITEHKMHPEFLEVSQSLCDKIIQTKKNGGRIIAVGTTSARSLETASLEGEIKPYSGETDIFIYPGFQFKCVDVLITNLHLPKSTLLMLVAAFIGYDNMKNLYQIALAEKYRFFSYGDAMWLEL